MTLSDTRVTMLQNQKGVKMGELAKHVDLIELLRAEGFEPRDVGGGRYNMCCPFHNETNPSFYVYPNNSYHCFGCCRGGDPIEFVRELHDLGFKQALDYLNINYVKVRKIIRKPDMLQTIADEEREGVNVLVKYGKELIDTLMFRRIKKEVKKHEKD